MPFLIDTGKRIVCIASGGMRVDLEATQTILNRANIKIVIVALMLTVLCCVVLVNGGEGFFRICQRMNESEELRRKKRMSERADSPTLCRSMLPLVVLFVCCQYMASRSNISKRKDTVGLMLTKLEQNVD